MAISTIETKAVIGAGFKTEITCSHPFVIDQPKAMGGNDEGPNPLEVFLSSLGACICALGRIIARQKRIDLRGMEVKVEGDLDKNFLMGKIDSGRAGFTEIRVFVAIDSDLSVEEEEIFLSDIALRCPVADNLINKTTIRSVPVAVL